MMNPAWRQIAAGLAVGFLLGGVFGVWRAQQKAPEWIRYSREEKSDRLLRRFSEKLKLTDTQRVEVKKALDSASVQTRALRAETRPRFRAIRAEMSRAIRAFLDEGQAKRFDEMEKEWNARKERWESKTDA